MVKSFIQNYLYRITYLKIITSLKSLISLKYFIKKSDILFIMNLFSY